VEVRPAAATPANEQPTSDAERAQLARLAHEFEAMFLSEMLRGMRESMLSDEKEEGLGNETMTDTFDSELGLSLSKSGGLGLANVMLDALVRRGGDPAKTAVAVAPQVFAAYSSVTSGKPASVTASVPEVASEAGPAVATESRDKSVVSDQGSAAVGPAAVVSAAAIQPGPVTSPFGWRADPFTGHSKFHAGTDVRMAYGHEVQAVAPGQVTSVGERSGYGLTVVIDHGNGLETRYAHLSGTSVREGDVVSAGQVVAQSGNSGRSTGPHLHLEARQNGRAIEIASLLKDPGMRADSYADRSHVRSAQ